MAELRPKRVKGYYSAEEKRERSAIAENVLDELDKLNSQCPANATPEQIDTLRAGIQRLLAQVLDWEAQHPKHS